MPVATQTASKPTHPTTTAKPSQPAPPKPLLVQEAEGTGHEPGEASHRDGNIVPEAGGHEANAGQGHCELQQQATSRKGLRWIKPPWLREVEMGQSESKRPLHDPGGGAQGQSVEMNGDKGRWDTIGLPPIGSVAPIGKDARVKWMEPQDTPGMVPGWSDGSLPPLGSVQPLPRPTTHHRPPDTPTPQPTALHRPALNLTISTDQDSASVLVGQPSALEWLTSRTKHKDNNTGADSRPKPPPTIQRGGLLGRLAAKGGSQSRVDGRPASRSGSETTMGRPQAHTS